MGVCWFVSGSEGWGSYPLFRLVPRGEFLSKSVGGGGVFSSGQWHTVNLPSRSAVAGLSYSPSKRDGWVCLSMAGRSLVGIIRHLKSTSAACLLSTWSERASYGGQTLGSWVQGQQILAWLAGVQLPSNFNRASYT